MGEPVIENQEKNENGIKKTNHTTVIVLIIVFIAGFVLITLFSDIEDVGTPEETAIPEERDVMKEIASDPELAELVDDGIGEGDLPEKEIGITVDATIGTFFTHSVTGKTLYTMIAGGQCTGECLLTWDPYLADDEVAIGELTTVFRDDLGRFQYAWKGQLLYTYIHDEKAGDVLGDGLFEIWHIARP